MITLLAIKGPKATEMSVNALIGCEVGEGEIVFTSLSDQWQHRSLHGMVRSIAANMLEGVTSGFKKDLEIRGVGCGAAQGFDPRDQLAARTRSIWRSSRSRSRSLRTSCRDGERNLSPRRAGAFAAKIRSFYPPELMFGTWASMLFTERRYRATGAPKRWVPGSAGLLTAERKISWLKKNKHQVRARRKQGLRKRIKGTSERPRLSVFRSAKHIYAQIHRRHRRGHPGRRLVAEAERRW